VRAGVGQPVVDLVGDQVEVVPLGQRDQRLQRGPRLHGAGRVRRRAEQDRLGARGERGGDQVGVDGETVLPAGRHRHRDAAGEPHARLVGDVAGFRHDHLVAGVEQHPQRQVQALRDAGGDQALGARVVVGAVAAGQVGADQLAQPEQPGVGGVGGVAVLQGVDPGLADPPRGDEVRLADAQGDHVVHLRGDVEELADPDGGQAAMVALSGLTG
jgi:hypothetical protein